MVEPQVFLIHSRLDTDLPNCFDKAAGKANMILWEAEWYEIPEGTSWQHLMNQIKASTAVFFIKGSNIANSTYTTNWVSWECGVAASMKKDLWVFESIHNPVFMPLPYLTDYVPYDPDDYEHIAWVAGLLQNYAQRNRRPEGIKIICNKCYAEYNLHTLVVSWNCPTCQRDFDWPDAAAQEWENLTDIVRPKNRPLEFAQYYDQVRRDLPSGG